MITFPGFDDFVKHVPGFDPGISINEASLPTFGDKRLQNSKRQHGEPRRTKTLRLKRIETHQEKNRNGGCEQRALVHRFPFEANGNITIPTRKDNAAAQSRLHSENVKLNHGKLVARVKSLEAELHKRHEHFAQSHAKLTEQIAKLSLENEELRAKVAQSETQRTGLLEKVGTLETSLSVASTENAVLKKDNDGLLKLIQEERNKGIEQDAACDDNAHKIEILQKENEGLLTTITSQDAKINQLRESLRYERRRCRFYHVDKVHNTILIPIGSAILQP